VRRNAVFFILSHFPNNPPWRIASALSFVAAAIGRDEVLVFNDHEPKGSCRQHFCAGKINLVTIICRPPGNQTAGVRL
jgi:hypothetical protein